LWSSARLTFEPAEMSEDKTSLTMRFWWLPRPAYSKEVDISTHLLWPTRDDDNPGSEAMPLPSFDLLQMQWFLNLVAAMSGVADVTDEEREDVSEGFPDNGDIVRETSEESSEEEEEEEEDDDDDIFTDPDEPISHALRAYPGRAAGA
ncbi:hypothetical protein AARAC_002246, partial [Aspergillus arachidicola]